LALPRYSNEVNSVKLATSYASFENLAQTKSEGQFEFNPMLPSLPIATLVTSAGLPYGASPIFIGRADGARLGV
jgi:hypothetical protein